MVKQEDLWETPNMVNINSEVRDCRLSSTIKNIYEVGSVSSLDIKNRTKGRAAPFPSLGLWLLGEETGPRG